MAENLNILSGLYVELEYLPAPLSKRVVAWGLDVSIQFFLCCFCYMALDSLTSNYGGGFSANLLSCLGYVSLVLLLLLPFLCEYFLNGQTIGKKLMRIAVVTDECAPPSFLQCVIRSLLFMVDFWLVGAILVSRKGKRLGDMASGCVVVLRKNSREEKVSLKEEFRYADQDFVPRFPEAKEMDERDFSLLSNALYSDKYYSQRDEVEKALKRHLHIAEADLKGRAFLLQLRNDYCYYKEMNDF